jgi:hypothetical protein
MIFRKVFLVLWLVFLLNCTTYVFYGEIRAEDSAGEMRNHLIYWTKTDRLLWFDECSETVRLLTERSLETVVFKETGNGIIFDDPNYRKVIHADDPELLGKILSSQKVKDLNEGVLELVLYATYDSTEFTIGDHHTLMAREEPYEFDVMKKKSSEFEDGVPKRPATHERIENN